MRNIHRIVIICVLGFVAAEDISNGRNEYCDVCEDHTMCKYKGLGKSCEGSDDGGITSIEKQYILDSHNWFRRIVSKGLETRGLNGTLPSAGNMQKMEWDEGLAEIAQRWADQCQFQHDSCRHDPRWKVGQNIYWNWRFPVLKSVNWTAAMLSWFDEVEKFETDVINSYTFNPETGHFTQLVWHDTTNLGCGRRSYGPNKIYVCNYGPTGNWLEESVYQTGEPCSSCPLNTICEDGLCAIKNEESVMPLNDEETVVDLTPPNANAVSVYSEVPNTTTDPSIRLNLIDDLDIPDDDEIRREIEDLKRRIRLLVDKIAVKNALKQEK